MGVSADGSDVELMSSMPSALDALDLLYARYGTLAYSVAIRVTRDPSSAEDAVQEAFLSVWRSASMYQPGRGTVRAWLLTVVHHRAVDALRRRKPMTVLPESDALPAPLRTPDVWAVVETNLDALAVRAAMGSLPTVQRDAIELAYFGGLTHVEIARRTGAPLGTVKSRMRSGLSAMQRYLRTHDIHRPSKSGVDEGRSAGPSWESRGPTSRQGPAAMRES